MKKLIALMIALAMVSVMLPCIALADDAIDTSKHVVITYMVTGDKPTNKTDEVLGKINEILTEKVNAELQIKWIEWTNWTTNYNLALATQSGDIDLVGTATDWLDAWPNTQKGAFLALSEDMLKTYAPQTWAAVPQEHWDLCKYDGSIYLIPEDQYAQWTNHGFMYRGDWAREAGLENGVNSWEELGTYLQYVKDNKEGVIPWDADGFGSSYSQQMAGGWQTSHTANVYIEGLGRRWLLALRRAELLRRSGAGNEGRPLCRPSAPHGDLDRLPHRNGKGAARLGSRLLLVRRRDGQSGFSEYYPWRHGRGRDIQEPRTRADGLRSAAQRQGTVSPDDVRYRRRTVHAGRERLSGASQRL